MNQILVTGATGQLGSAVINSLLKDMAPEKISMLSRNNEKKELFGQRGFKAFQGSYDHIPSLENAMIDTETVLLISSGDQGDRMQEHKNVIDTALKMGVQNIAYTSRSLKNRNTLANQLMAEHFETEDYIKASGLKYILFRNALYMDAIHQFVGGNRAIDSGIFLPAGNGKVAYALRSEQGEAMGNVLLKNNFVNQTYYFTGNQAYSFHDIAETLSSLSGKEVRYHDIEPEKFAASMKQRNVPELQIAKILAFITDIKNDQEALIYTDLEENLKRKPANLSEGLKTIFEL